MSQLASPGFNQGRLSDEEFEAVVHSLQQKMAHIDELPESFRDRLISLLNDLDRMHREALQRMLEQVEKDAPEVSGRLLRDPAIQTLLLLYELSPELQAKAEEEAQDPLIGLEGGEDA